MTAKALQVSLVGARLVAAVDANAQLALPVVITPEPDAVAFRHFTIEDEEQSASVYTSPGQHGKSEGVVVHMAIDGECNTTVFSTPIGEEAAAVEEILNSIFAPAAA